jgi:hypothetical protein
MSTLLDEDLETIFKTTDDGDHERFAHYFRKEDIERAYFDGAEITALCGKKDIPTRDFTKFPVCPECKEVMEGLSD